MTPSDARDVLRSMGVPVPSVDDVLFVSTPVKYKSGRLRLFILTRSTMVYARSLDPFQTIYNLIAAKGAWDLDWAAPTEHLAFVDDDDGSGAPSVGGGKAEPAALLVVHLRQRDAWLGDPSSTRMRAIAVDPTQLEETRDRLRRVMSAAGRTPELCWAERPTQTALVVYLRRRADGGGTQGVHYGQTVGGGGGGGDASAASSAAAASWGALVGLLERICRDHGLIPTVEGGAAGSGGGGAVTHHCIRATTPSGAPTAMEVRLRLGRHVLKGEMLVVEYRRMEAEDAAWKGLQVAGMVVAFAALGGLAVVAGTAIASASSGGGGASGSGTRGGGGSVSYGRRRRHGGGGGGTYVYYFGGPSLGDCMPGGGGGGGGGHFHRQPPAAATAAPAWRPAPSGGGGRGAGAGGVAGAAPWVVQATDRRLGSGTAARDAFFDRFSTNLRAALANADFVASPSSPALFALVREDGRRGESAGGGSARQSADRETFPSAAADRPATAGNGESLDEELDDWTLVLTPESQWGATAADEPSAPPPPPPGATSTGGAEAAASAPAPPEPSDFIRTYNDAVTPPAAHFSVAASSAASVPSGAAPHLFEGPAPGDVPTVAPAAPPHMSSRDASPATSAAADDPPPPASMSRSGVLRLDVDSDGVPKNFLCPITQDVFEDPVIWVDGHTYSRGAMSQWLRRKDTSPMTGERFVGAGALTLLPNHAMRSQVEEWRSQHVYRP